VILLFFAGPSWTADYCFSGCDWGGAGTTAIPYRVDLTGPRGDVSFQHLFDKSAADNVGLESSQ